MSHRHLITNLFAYKDVMQIDHDSELQPVWSFKGVSIWHLVSDQKSYPEVHPRPRVHLIPSFQIIFSYGMVTTEFPEKKIYIYIYDFSKWR